jgi:hypothetical protein
MAVRSSKAKVQEIPGQMLSFMKDHPVILQIVPGSIQRLGATVAQ